jgi:predicted GNAT family acetyltransferase
MERGDLVVVASFEGTRLCGAGSAAPRGDVAELMGIAVPPGHRHRGHGTSITRSLVAACREQGVDLVFLSAGSDAAAEIYRRIGFVDVGTACVLELDD